MESHLTPEQRAEGLTALGVTGVPSAGGQTPTQGSVSFVPGDPTPGGGQTLTVPGPGGGTVPFDPGTTPDGPRFDLSNLQATDTGVTPNEIVVANIADIKGVQPGLFQSVRDAANAAAAYINATGGINGRAVKLLSLDGKTDSGANRAAMQEACDSAFVVAGSMSAFDDGSAAPGEECGIPDLTAISTNPPKFRASNTFPIFPNSPDELAVGNARHLAAKYPEEIKKAGILWLNQAVTRGNALRRRDAWTKGAGFNFIYEQEVQVLEADYSRFVLDMESQGVEYVTMVSDYQNIVRLQQAMRQQGYTPTLRDWDSVVYDGGYISLGGEAVEGSGFFINTYPFEEAASNPEMQLYIDWLGRAVPGAEPTYFGIYAWSAFRLFQDLALNIDPNKLTRASLLDAIKGATKWTGHGIHAPQNVGGKKPTNCFFYGKVSGGKFVREHPSEGLACGGELVRLDDTHE